MITESANGATTFDEKTRGVGVQRIGPVKALSVAYVQLVAILVLLAVVLLEVLIVIPGQRDIAAQMCVDRDAEVKHLKLIEDARSRQVVQEATILLHQKENLRIAEELKHLLKGSK